MSLFGSPSAASILAAAWVLIAIAAAVIIARIYLRLKIQRTRLLNSDGFMCASLVFAIIASSLNVPLANLGAFDRGVTLSLQNYHGSFEEATQVNKIFWVWGLMFLTALYLSKAALLSLYLKVFPLFIVKRRMVLWATVGFIASAYCVSILVHLLICLPVETNWDLTGRTNCLPAKPAIVFKITWSLHISGDIMIFLLPWLIITKLKLKTSLRVGVYCTFLLGIVNIIIAVVRYIAISSAMNGKDVTFSVLMLFNTLDCNLCLIIACLPSLRPYFSLRSNPASGQAGYQKPLDETKGSHPRSGPKTHNVSFNASNSRSAPHRSSAHLVDTPMGLHHTDISRSESPDEIELRDMK